VQLLVSVSDGVPLKKMANIAGKLVEIVSKRGSSSIAAVTKQPATPPQITVAESPRSLQEQVATLSIAVKQLTNTDRGRTQKNAHIKMASVFTTKRTPLVVEAVHDDAQQKRLFVSDQKSGIR
jgi:hypothetical protein